MKLLFLTFAVIFGLSLFSVEASPKNRKCSPYVEVTAFPFPGTEYPTEFTASCLTSGQEVDWYMNGVYQITSTAIGTQSWWGQQLDSGEYEICIFDTISDQKLNCIHWRQLW